MEIPCCTPPVLCDDPSRPIGNFSSQTPDQTVFIARFYDPRPEPPIGPRWRTTGCVGVCESTVSQQAADECAQRQQVICDSVQNPNEEPNPNPDLPPVTTPQQIYGNEEQTCLFPCDDGSTFAYTINAGTFMATSQAEANAIARSTACNRAALNRICINDLASTGACVGSYYEQNVHFLAINQPVVVSLVSGSLPPGIVISNDEDSFTLFGIPTIAGGYPFVVRVEDSNGLIQDRSFTIYVIEIAQSSLPNAQVGVAYSQTLTANGPTLGVVTWAILSGALPAGLSLVGDTISGTPTTAQVSPFIVSMTDQR